MNFRFLILLLLCLFVHQLCSQTVKAFYIGHSLSDQIPDMVQSLSDDHSSADFSWVYQSIPGAPLRWQWDRKDAMDYTPIAPNYYGFSDTEFGLPAGDFDVLVLTESVPRYWEIIDETYEYADSFFRYATSFNPDIRVFLYEDWHCVLSGTPTDCSYDVDSNPWRQRLEDDLAMWESVVDTLNSRYEPSVPVCLIPAGQGLAALYDSIQVGAIPDITSIEDLFSDDIHLNDIGKYFIACIHFAMIHGTSPLGLTNQLQVWWGGDFTAPSEALALKFQEIAWEVVNNYPGSCLGISSSLSTISDENSISQFPNPTAGLFSIHGLSGESRIQVLDAAGNVYETNETEEENVEMNIESLPSGLYLVKIIDGKRNSTTVKKVLKHN